MNQKTTQQLEEFGSDLEETYEKAVNLRNKFADTTRTSELRRDGEELYESLDNLCETMQSILRELADKTDKVDTEYMVREGWELSDYGNHGESLAL